MNASVFAENKNPKVVVIGAGLAGLTTAYRLEQKGIDVQVYEARTRVGGRVLTAKVEGSVVELGGQNVLDGGRAENMCRLISELGLGLEMDQLSFTHFYFSGETLIPIQELLKKRQFNPDHLKKQLDDVSRKSKNMQEVLRSFFQEDDPLYQWLSVRLASYEGATIEKLSSFYIETLYHMLLGGLASAHKNNEPNFVTLSKIKGGNALLAEGLVQELEGRVHFNKALAAVSKTLDGSYLLTFQDEEKVKADFLVLAIPCSVYRAIDFDENIFPEEKLQAIKNVQYGTNAKIMVPFSKPPFKRTGVINDRVVSFFNADRTVLTLYYAGEAGQFSIDTILNTYSQERPMLEMGFQEMCPPFAAPVFAKDEQFVFYEGPVGYSWIMDPYAKGSYSYIAPGQELLFTALQEEDGELVKTLFAPLDQRLYFAGEHTSILLEVAGTMEAACESGERVARMIKKAYER